MLYSSSMINPGNPENIHQTALSTDSDSQFATGISTVLSPAFRGGTLLEVVDDNDFRTYGGEENTDSVSGEFEDLPRGQVYDVALMNGALGRSKNPLGLLAKVSRISRFAIIQETPEAPTLPLLTGPERTGSIDTDTMSGNAVRHFGKGALRDMVEASGFEVLFEGTPDTKGEPLTLLKSRKFEVMHPDIAEKVHDAMIAEFGEGNVIAAGIFGSTTRSAEKINSDFDYTLIVDGLSSDVYEREKASPNIKRRLRDMGVGALCAFNIYSPEEFSNAAARKLWLIESMKTGYRVVHDTDEYLAGILDAKLDNVERVEDRFAWRGVEYADQSRFEHVIDRHMLVADVIKDVDGGLANYHRREAMRVELIAKLHSHGESTSRGSLLSLAQRLHTAYGEQLDMSVYEQADFQQEMEGKRSMYGYDTVDRHLRVSEVLEANGMPLEALSHAATAIRNVYLETLHTNDNYIIDGEVTQLFLRQFAESLPVHIVDSIYASSFKAEQILGRTGFLSFDLDANGKPIYENPETTTFNYIELITKLRSLIHDLRSSTLVNNDIIQENPVASIIATPQGDYAQTYQTVAAMNSLIIPRGKAELVLAGSFNATEQERLAAASEMPIKFVQTERGDDLSSAVEISDGSVAAFIGANMIPSPLWLVNILSGFKNDRTAAVSGSSSVRPDRTGFDSAKARHATMDITGQVIALSPHNAGIRKDVLIKLDGPQASAASPEEDMAHRIRSAGYTVAHVTGEVAYY
jgi:hypothetical protein